MKRMTEREARTFAAGLLVAALGNYVIGTVDTNWRAALSAVMGAGIGAGVLWLVHGGKDE